MDAVKKNADGGIDAIKEKARGGMAAVEEKSDGGIDAIKEKADGGIAAGKFETGGGCGTKGEKKRPYLAAVSGVKNSGKTTFLEKLIPVLCSRGYRTALIKHDGHEFQGDVPGTDTWRLKKAGAYGTAIFSGTRWMAVKEQPRVSPEELCGLFPEADVILLEGLKESSFPKFEVVRSAVSDRMVCDPKTVLALVSDYPKGYFESCPEIPVCGFGEMERCADILEEAMKKWRSGL